LKTQDLEFFSHSASDFTLKVIFKFLLKCHSPGSVAKGKTFCDVGSRLGAGLYSAHVIGDFGKVIGVEMNERLVTLQREAIQEFQLENVSVVQGRIEEQSQEFMDSIDVFLFHNVFEFFNDRKQQKQIWTWLIKSICRPGQILVTIPDLLEQLADCFDGEDDDLDFESAWVLDVTPREMISELSHVLNWDGEMLENAQRICVYQVPPKV